MFLRVGDVHAYKKFPDKFLKNTIFYGNIHRYVQEMYLIFSYKTCFFLREKDDMLQKGSIDHSFTVSWIVWLDDTDPREPKSFAVHALEPRKISSYLLVD